MHNQPPDRPTDVYGLGAVAYYTLTGRPPFMGQTPMEVMVAHARDPVTPPSQLQPNIPPDLEAIVLRCLRKTPKIVIPPRGPRTGARRLRRLGTLVTSARRGLVGAPTCTGAPTRSPLRWSRILSKQPSISPCRPTNVSRLKSPDTHSRRRPGSRAGSPALPWHECLSFQNPRTRSPDHRNDITQ